MSKKSFPFTKTGGLLLFIICAFVFAAWYVILSETTYLLTIENRSASTITNLSITTTDISKQITEIKPNEKTSIRFSFQHDGNLMFEAEQNKIKLAGTIEGYVTGSIGGKATLIFKDDGQHEIKYEYP